MTKSGFNNRLLIYGCGSCGKSILGKCLENGISVDALVISDGKEVNMNDPVFNGIQVFRLSELPEMYKDYLIIPAVMNRKDFNTITNELVVKGYKNIWKGSSS